MAEKSPIARRRALRVNPSIARYLEAFVTTRGVLSLAGIVAVTAIAFLAPVLFPDGYDVQSRL